MTAKDLGLKERTRRAVQSDLAEVAAALFVERGFAATTIDEVAAAVGMSRRSVFRYFASKEDIMLRKVDFAGENMLSSLRSRPVGETIWTSLRRMFDVMTEVETRPGDQAFVESTHRIVFDTPALLAGYLERLQRLQDDVAAELVSRAQAAGHPYAEDDPTPRAVTAAAFGCLVAAQRTWLASGADTSLGEALERAMATIGPTAQ